MRTKLDENVLENVTGGTVVISYDKMMVGFRGIGEKYKLVNCTYEQARNLAESLWMQNQSLGDADFDRLVRDTYRNNGWI
jgi:hypothetical protein